MRDVVYNLIKNELNLRERMVVRIFSKTFNKVYNISRTTTFNNILN